MAVSGCSKAMGAGRRGGGGVEGGAVRGRDSVTLRTETRGGAQGSKRSDDDAAQNNCGPKTAPQKAVKRCACRRLHPSTGSQDRKRTAMRAGGRARCWQRWAAQSTRQRR